MPGQIVTVKSVREGKAYGFDSSWFFIQFVELPPYGGRDGYWALPTQDTPSFRNFDNFFKILSHSTLRIKRFIL